MPSPESDEDEMAATEEKFGALTDLIVDRRKKAVDARAAAGIDARWLADIDAMEGRDGVSEESYRSDAKINPQHSSTEVREPAQSRIVPNFTRPKVRAAAQKLALKVFPSDDRNWDLVPSTVPELAKEAMNKETGITHNGKPVMVGEPGQERQATAADMADTVIAQAKDAAEAMTKEIDDQLDQSRGGCGFESVGRKVIFDAALLGVGVIKGPIVRSKTRKVWLPVQDGGKTVHSLKRHTDLKPVSEWVDPLTFSQTQNAAKTFMMALMSSKARAKSLPRG
jgi:hypothetical protein